MKVKFSVAGVATMINLVAPMFMLASAVLAGDRPNILWLTSEDNSYDSLGCYGNKLARTPNLDALAKKGILFENCYSMPVCAPSRFTLITGMYPTTCGPAQHMRASGKIPGWLTDTTAEKYLDHKKGTRHTGGARVCVPRTSRRSSLPAC